MLICRCRGVWLGLVRVLYSGVCLRALGERFSLVILCRDGQGVREGVRRIHLVFPRLVSTARKKIRLRPRDAPVWGQPTDWAHPWERAALACPARLIKQKRGASDSDRQERQKKKPDGIQDHDGSWIREQGLGITMVHSALEIQR